MSSQQSCVHLGGGRDHKEIQPPLPPKNRAPTPASFTPILFFHFLVFKIGGFKVNSPPGSQHEVSHFSVAVISQGLG